MWARPPPGARSVFRRTSAARFSWSTAARARRMLLEPAAIWVW
ncbi:MAG: hypothetical protein ACK55Z_10330 [bacterium]